MEYMLYTAIGYIPDLDEWPEWRVVRLLKTHQLWTKVEADRMKQEARRARA